MEVGMDVGASLTKIVEISDAETRYKTFDNKDLGSIAKSFFDAKEVYATGCGAGWLKETLSIPVTVNDELKSFCAGARYLMAKQEGVTEPFVLASFGTGTSIFKVTKDASCRVAGTGVGGGTISGLANLLGKETSFEKIVAMAEIGDRKLVDLMVKDIYPLSDSPVEESLTAANFGKQTLSLASKEDIFSATLQLVVEVIAVLSIEVAKRLELDVIAVAGSPSTSSNVQKRFKEIGDVFGYRFLHIEKGAYCGAIGTLLLSGKMA